MGRHYAAHFGHLFADPDAVARAIDEHWSPRGQGGALPSTDVGAILAIADRMDTAVGMFAAGLEPTGNADPFGIRRAAIGIWLILLDRGWSTLWLVAFDSARAALAEQGVAASTPPGAVVEKLEKFFRDRLRGIFVDQGIPGPDADAVLAQDFRDPVDALARGKAIAKIPQAAREVFKRTANILDDARTKNKLTIGDAVDPSLFARESSGPGVEQRLHDGVAAARAREVEARARRDYAAVFESLVQLQPTVAAFFDKGGVMVMDPDPKLRDNRLALLNWFIAPYMAIADFRLLVSPGSPG
jgi:glycyl-tRNA synthetase beta chain